jgi:NADH dehydrogenase (ubiquinone) 1 alpha subcomplex subunit 9
MASLRSSDVVINMIGKHYETKHLVPTRRANGKLSRVNYGFEEVNVTIPATLAELAAEAGVKSFIHVSALSADLESKSEWSRTKAQGEIAVREHFPNAIIVKPATVFGSEDRFLNWMAEVTNRFPAFPLLNNGQTEIQPVFANDVGKAIMNIIIENEKHAGKTFQLVGPAKYSYKEVAEFVMDVTTVQKPMLDIPVQAAAIVGRGMQELINPVLTEDGVAQMCEDNVEKIGTEMLGFADLGMIPAPMDKVSFDFLHRFRPGGHFTTVEGYH